MIEIHKKGSIVPIGKYLASKDFDCHCTYPDCLETPIDRTLLTALDELWELTGGFQVTSGHRCQKHNADIKGAKDSQHLLGKAADCKSLKNYKGQLMAQWAEKIDVFKNGGIGIYPTFVHVDTRAHIARWGTPKEC